MDTLPNRALAQQYSVQHGYSMDIVFDDLESMLKATTPEAVTAFGTIYDHLSVVEACAPKGIHVMVEKPLAVSWDQRQFLIAASLGNLCFHCLFLVFPIALHDIVELLRIQHPIVPVLITMLRNSGLLSFRRHQRRKAVEDLHVAGVLEKI